MVKCKLNLPQCKKKTEMVIYKSNLKKFKNKTIW